MRGKFIAVFGPTGSGKGTLVSYIKEEFPNLIYPRTKTTRKRRPAENSKTLYDFVSEADFKKSIKNGDFVEWAEFSGNLYGTPKKPVEDAISSGEIAFKELEVQGVRQLIEIMPREDLFIIYIDGGPWEVLKNRISSRAPITDEDVEERRKRYEDEVRSKDLANVVVENHDGMLEDAKKKMLEVVKSVL